MSADISIRKALDSDAPRIAELIQGFWHYFLADPSGEGAEGFLESISAAAIVRYINDPSFFYIVGIAGEDLVGVGALKDNRHLYHLFVHPDYHREGVARQLWQHLEREAAASGKSEKITVNSTSFAVPVYERFGFVPCGELQVKNGVQFQPMELAKMG